MDPWQFVTAAYAVTLIGAGALAALSWRALRRAEDAVESQRRG